MEDKKQLDMNTLLGSLGQMMNQARPTEWWHNLVFPEVIDFSVNKLINFAKSALFTKALADDKLVVYDVSYDDNTSELIHWPKLQNFIDELTNVKLVYNYQCNYLSIKFYVSSDSAFQIIENTDAAYSFNNRIDLVTTNKEMLDYFNKNKSSFWVSK